MYKSTKLTFIRHFYKLIGRSSLMSSKLDEYLARIDRLPTWGLSYALLWALGIGYFATLYDAVSNLGYALPFIPFINAIQASIIVSVGLAGYIIGSIGLGIASDRIGRRPILVSTFALLCIGSLGMGLSTNYFILLVFRIIEGIGIGASLNLAMVYVAEFSPSMKRGKYANWIFISGWTAVGVGTVAAAFIVTLTPAVGWRVIFLIPGILSLITTVILAILSPESIRILIRKGKVQEVEKIVNKMEEVSMKRAKVESLPQPKIVHYEEIPSSSQLKILREPKYLKRLISLIVFWFFIYFIQYTSTGLGPTFVKVVVGFSSAQYAEYIRLSGFAAIGATIISFILLGVVERTDRRLLTQIGGIGFLVSSFVSTYLLLNKELITWFIAYFLLEFVVNPPYLAGYLMSSEAFPTAARSTGFAITDGIGHLGGVIGPLLLFPLIKIIGPLPAWVVLGLPVPFAAALLWFTIPKTVGVRLEEVNEAFKENTGR
ncbi:MFS transporter [Sulfolobus sp. E5-1-F]|uniref:MFS transporter n=1 Tax=Sulfolobaceae TaxID=118883 RepID=UPI001297C377|nr:MULTISPECIES: MFS transporter [unclassified Sulfolobus]QGA53650.1 MFS transporter [Sulfolobus sp. E5-1-F]QGA68693.1 MFS transporter [Sulfolobus sp. E11-6]